VRIRCGGLPVHPKGPLGYSLLFSIEGLTNEYTGEAVVLREGEIRRLEAFTEVEPFNGPRVLGRCEAFLTSGGTSTAPWTFEGRLQTYDYKTVRYQGHYAIMRAIIDLGLLDTACVDGVSPRDVFHAVCGPRFDEPGIEDLAVLRVDCTDGGGRGVRFQMLQYKDAGTGFTAMEQGTGYPTAVVAHALARAELPRGALTPERAGFGEPHLRALRKRGLRIHRRTLG
jgi:lysine 6-dehydrogenase